VKSSIASRPCEFDEF